MTLACEMYRNKAEPLWQDAFIACGELDVAQSMPVVAKPIPVGDELMAFPSAKASVASLLAEGPRKEPVPSEKVPDKGKATSSKAEPKPGALKSKSKSSSSSSKAACKPGGVQSKTKSSSSSSKAAPKPGDSKSEAKDPGNSSKPQLKPGVAQRNLKGSGTNSKPEPKLSVPKESLKDSGVLAAAAPSLPPVGMPSGEPSEVEASPGLGKEDGPGSAPAAKGYASVSLYIGKLTTGAVQKKTAEAIDPVASLVAASQASDGAAQPCGDAVAAGALVAEPSADVGNRFTIVPEAVDGSNASFAAVVEATFEKYGVKPCSKRCGFADWIGALPLEDRSVLASSLARFEITRQAWLIRAAVPKRLQRPFKAVSRHGTPIGEVRRNSAVRDRITIGEKYSTWLQSQANGGSYHPPPPTPFLLGRARGHPPSPLDGPPLSGPRESRGVCCQELIAQGEGGDR